MRKPVRSSNINKRFNDRYNFVICIQLFSIDLIFFFLFSFVERWEREQVEKDIVAGSLPLTKLSQKQRAAPQPTPSEQCY